MRNKLDLRRKPSLKTMEYVPLNHASGASRTS